MPLQRQRQNARYDDEDDEEEDMDAVRDLLLSAIALPNAQVQKLPNVFNVFVICSQGGGGGSSKITHHFLLFLKKIGERIPPIHKNSGNHGKNRTLPLTFG